MARVFRIVLPGTPHHVTQRQRLFLEAGDYALYRDLAARRTALSA